MERTSRDILREHLPADVLRALENLNLPLPAPEPLGLRHIWEGDIPEERLWRYLRPERFEAFLRDGTVHFASANQFTDRFEGAVAVMPPDFPVDPRYAEPEGAEHAFRELKRLTKISCWHRAEYESDAMWQLYADERKGLAICSTPDRMNRAFQPFRLKPEYGHESLWAGKVKYVDLLQVRMNAGMETRFFYKHRAFEWEREFRLAISVRSAEEYGVPVPENGIYVTVDPKILIEKIMLGPALPGADVERVAKAAQAAGLGDRLVKSSLLGTPRYV